MSQKTKTKKGLSSAYIMMGFEHALDASGCLHLHHYTDGQTMHVGGTHWPIRDAVGLRPQLAIASL